MILDSLENINAYEQINPLFKKAFDYLKNENFVKSEVGKVHLLGDDLFAIISDSEMKSADDANIEVHNRYIDIQLPISKPEKFGWISRTNLENECTLFDEAKDIQFFKEPSETFIDVFPGNFIIFFPNDGHAPCIGEGKIRKVVVKVKI